MHESTRPQFRRRMLGVVVLFATACVHGRDVPPGERVVAEVRALPAPRSTQPPELPLAPDQLARLLQEFLAASLGALV
jgi:hypothetical protein